VTDDLERRVAGLEGRIDSAFALDARLEKLEDDVRKLRKSSLRDWLQTLAPYISGLVVLIVGYKLKDSVDLALRRETLDLQYVTQMRDLIKEFDAAATQPAADANAVGLAMFGKFAIVPLVERLEGGDVASIAAERGLRLVGSNNGEEACPKLAQIIADKGKRYRWSTHKTVVKLMGQSSCTKQRSTLDAYDQALENCGSDAAKLAKFGARYSDGDTFDAESANNVRAELHGALDMMKDEGQP
jgi:hypothetical protein